MAPTQAQGLQALEFSPPGSTALGSLCLQLPPQVSLALGSARLPQDQNGQRAKEARTKNRRRSGGTPAWQRGRESERLGERAGER